MKQKGLVNNKAKYGMECMKLKVTDANCQKMWGAASLNDRNEC